MQKLIKLLKKVLPSGLVKPFLPLYHLAQAVAANIKYRFPAKQLKVIAVTGTNGKTTTAHYITSILEAAGYKVGLSTTAQFKIGERQWDNELNMTVTDPFKLQAMMRQMKEADVDWVVLEVTSHALMQHRIWGIPIHTAVMTNLTQDHLDYHKTMDAYAAAKGKLFRLAKYNSVLNHDDDWFDYFNQVAPQHKFSYGANAGTDVHLTKAALQADGSKLKFTYGQDGPELTAHLQLLGRFNVYNALAAATVAHALELDKDFVARGMEAVAAVPGRMEAVKAKDFSVLVDYAHTPDALKNVFETLRPLTRGKLIAVFGATGDRDKTKRPLMGEVAAKLCDVVIVTDDDPYTEDAEAIRNAVMIGTKFDGSKAKVHEVADRRKAIAKAFTIANRGDTVAILGLGHQHFRVVGDAKQAWDDRQVAAELLAAK